MIETYNLKLEMNENEKFLINGPTSCITQFEIYCKDKTLNTVIDIGANIGCFSLISTVLANVEQVIAVEANILNYFKLCNNIANNNLWGKIIPLPYAVSRERGKIIPIYGTLNGNSGQHSLLFKEGFPRTNFIRTISLNDLCRNYKIIDYMKVDVEGSEYDIFYPSEETLQVLQKIDILEIELHPPTNEEFYDLSEFLKNRSYYSKFVTIEEGLLQFIIDCEFEILVKPNEHCGSFVLKNKHL